MCVLVEAIDDRISNRQFDIHLKGLAGRKRHTGVMTTRDLKPPSGNSGLGENFSMGP